MSKTKKTTKADTAASEAVPEEAPGKSKPARTTASTRHAEGQMLTVDENARVYLIDGSGYIFRAFHALPPLTRASDGLPVGAVQGFSNMLWKLLKDSKPVDQPTHIAVIFDAGAKTFRNEIYTDYKANRPPAPEDLIPQFPLIRDAVKAFNVACIELDGYEADDLIATYAVEASAKGAQVTIISSDKDLMQLVGPSVTMYDTMKNKRIGAQEVVEKFGVGPDKVIDVQSLAGDSVDNVPGVPGIGIKTAAQLIHEYGDLDGLLARASEIKQPKRRERLIEFADQARISRDLVTLKRDVPIEIELATTGVHEPNPADVFAFLREMEFRTLTNRVAKDLGEVPPKIERVIKPAAGDGDGKDAGAGEGAATPSALVAFNGKLAQSAPLDPARYETVTTLARLGEWISDARAAGRFAFDTETDSLDAMQANLIGFSMSVSPGKACYVPLAHIKGDGGLDFGPPHGGSEPLDDNVEGDSGGDGSTGKSAHEQMDLRAALDALQPLLEDPSILVIGQNLKYDALVLSRYDLSLVSIDDTMLLSYVLDAGRGSHGMDALALRHLGYECIPYKQVIAHAPGKKIADKSFAGVPIDKATQYAAEDADITLRLWLLLKPRLVAEQMTTVYELLERPLVPVLVEMEGHGIKVDRSILSRLSGDFAQRIAALEAQVFELAGETFNLGSPKQLGELLFDKLRLPGGKKTKTGQWETRAGLLDDLSQNEELPDDARTLINTMLEWRQLSKLKSTYTDALPGHINPVTKRIHTSYAMAGTTTGRLASTDPNLQNIPIRTKEGREIRTAFIADKGNKLISADYSQIELRVLAHIADIPELKRAFADGLDIHAMTASEMFGVPIKDMPSETRRRAKAINFGIIYGISAFGLAAQLGISRGEAGDYIKTYFQRFPGIKDYMEQTKAYAREHGFVETIFGRRIHYPQINAKNGAQRAFNERAAINAPIQGSAADIIRRAMTAMPSVLGDAGLDQTRMLLQVHDELIFEAKAKDVDQTLAVVVRTMEGAALPARALSVPLKVEALAADNWDEAH